MRDLHVLHRLVVEGLHHLGPLLAAPGLAHRLALRVVGHHHDREVDERRGGVEVAGACGRLHGRGTAPGSPACPWQRSSPWAAPSPPSDRRTARAVFSPAASASEGTSSIASSSLFMASSSCGGCGALVQPADALRPRHGDLATPLEGARSLSPGSRGPGCVPGHGQGARRTKGCSGDARGERPANLPRELAGAERLLDEPGAVARGVRIRDPRASRT